MVRKAIKDFQEARQGYYERLKLLKHSVEVGQEELQRLRKQL